MEDKRFYELVDKLLEFIKDYSNNTTTYIFEYYKNHKNQNINKIIYDMYADAFRDINAYLVLVDAHDYAQAATIMRLAIERTSKITCFSRYPELIDKYISRKQEYDEYLKLSKSEKESFEIERNIAGIDVSRYFDYGWADDFKSDGINGLNHIIKLAGLEVFRDDIKKTLNKFVHGSISIFQFNGGEKPWDDMRKQMRRLDVICLNLYGFLFDSFRRVFYINNNPFFLRGLKIYEQIMKLKEMYES